MSLESDRLFRVETCMKQALKQVTVGTANREVKKYTVEIALERAEAWAKWELPKEGEPGGSTSPQGKDERDEAERTKRLGLEAAEAIPRLAKQLERDASALYLLIQRCAAVVDKKKLEQAPEIPGCVSCARKDGDGAQAIGGHFAPAMPAQDEETPDRKIVRGDVMAAFVGLCRWCADHAKVRAAEIGSGISDRETWPSILACHLRHSRSARAAGQQLMAEQAEREKQAKLAS